MARGDDHQKLLRINSMRATILALIGVLAPVDGLQAWRPVVHAAAFRGAARTTSISLQGDFFKGLADKASEAAGNAAGKAFAEIERQASIAAGQEQIPDEPDIPLQPARPLPDSFEDSVSLAVDAVAEAVADGTTKMVVEFDTSAGDETYNLQSRTLKFVQPFLGPFADAVSPDYDEPPPPADGAAVGPDGEVVDERPPRVQVLFGDEGTAAYARKNWGASLPPRTQCGSMPRASVEVGADVLMLVTPQATEVQAVQRLMRQVDELSPGTIVLLINPKLVDMQSTGYGLVGRELRDMVANNFNVAFALKSCARCEIEGDASGCSKPASNRQPNAPARTHARAVRFDPCRRCDRRPLPRLPRRLVRVARERGGERRV